MGDFKRSPSKVWWMDDNVSLRLHSSASPGSQDSGFSDTEIAPSQKNIIRDLTKDDSSKDRNSTEQYKEKTIPHTVTTEKLNRTLQDPRPSLYQKKARKSLFKIDLTGKAGQNHQYAKGDNNNYDTKSQQISSEVTFNGSNVSLLQETISTYSTHQQRLNRSAPAALGIVKENDDERAEAEDISDCDSEIEKFFCGSAESPKHTSTPKTGRLQMRQCKRRAAFNLHQMKFQRDKQHARVPPIDVMSIEENPASVRSWLEDVRILYETECMTTLQCKSIAAELTQKVLNLAARITSPIREVLTQSHAIEKEFENLKSQTKYKGPLTQNLVCTLSEFLQIYDDDVDTSSACRLCDALRRSNPDDILRLSSQLHETFRKLNNELLVNRVLRLTERLENPTSEMEFRATLTGITSLCLRYENLIDLFINAGAVSTLLIFCEKCDGSSVRIAVLRALSTICYNDIAVRQLEKASGIQLISEILSDQSRPEPELSESIALLAQITAPWIDGNHQNLQSLQTESRHLIEYLTKFLETTKCCQNMLLCTAALANISSVIPKSVKYIIQQGTVKVLFDAVQRRGPHGSIYLLEQVACLLANMSSSEQARKQLIEEKAPAVLLLFLQSISDKGEEAEKRLQQKTIIALSRLCSDSFAAEQMVSLGGVQKLVQLCRDKKKRFNSDAILVAALATLRKIVDCCGPSVINAQDAQELVEPRLLDSFLAYSAQNESYV